MIFYALVAVLCVLLLGALPLWPHSRRWGFGGAAGIAVLIALVVWLRLDYVL